MKAYHYLNNVSCFHLSKDMLYSLCMIEILLFDCNSLYAKKISDITIMKNPFGGGFISSIHIFTNDYLLAASKAATKIPLSKVIYNNHYFMLTKNAT